MSEHTINLRSDSPALLVEFNLSPGTHARIGAALNAEISLPLAGLAEYACLIGRTPKGRIYVADADGENQRFVELPAALPLPPFQFVIFHPVAETENTPAPTTRSEAGRLHGKTTRRFIPAAIVSAAVIALAALVVLDQSRQPATTSQKPQATQQTPPEQSQEKPETSPEVVAVAKPATSAPTPESKPEPPPAKLDLEALAQKVAPAVFRLEVKDAAGNLTGTGTAFAISADGLAVTNFHVVEDGATLTARTTQGAEFAVSGVTATDPDADLALLTLKASALPFLELGDSDSLKIGAPVAVFGAPEGLTGSLSNGILSAKRTGAEFEDKSMPNGGRLLQITAPISHGSSGSPVIDQSGKVVAVAAASIPGDRAQSLNLGIPVEAVKKLRNDSLAGLARGFSGSRRNITPDPPESQATENTPETAFFRDPEFQTVKRQFIAADWIAMQKTAKQLVGKYPEAPSAHFYFGVALFGLDLHESAELAAKRGLALSADHAPLWLILGSAQLAQNRHLEARASFRKSAAISPENSLVWQKLSASFLMSGEYLDAVSPLEKLRKLDRIEFDRLLAICRSLRVHPPQLQSMLYHFDTMEDSVPPKAAPVTEQQTSPETLAATLVSSFLAHGEGASIQTELADYAATVNPYFDQGQQGRTAILKDLTTYRAQWPKRSLRLLGIESARRDDLNTLEATYRLRYSASDGKKNRSGTLVQGIRYTLTDGRWLVSGIQTIERVNE